jgi:hypothetical protein
MASEIARREALWRALGILEGLGMLPLDEPLAEAIVAKLDEDRMRDLFMLLVVQGLDLRSRQTPEQREAEASAVVTALRYLGNLGWCSAKSETLEELRRRIAAGMAGGVRIIVGMPGDERSES